MAFLRIGRLDVTAAINRRERGAIRPRFSRALTGPHKNIVVHTAAWLRLHVAVSRYPKEL